MLKPENRYFFNVTLQNWCKARIYNLWELVDNVLLYKYDLVCFSRFITDMLVFYIYSFIFLCFEILMCSHLWPGTHYAD